MRTLGSRYVLHELLGQGTTGEVWRASRRDNGDDVAIKMLRPEFADDQVVVDRFLREWQILYDINSPELVRVLDLVNEPDALAIVMELVDGTDLREYLRHSAPLPVEQAVRILIHVLWALDTVHGAGVVHRDVKPENVLLDERNGDGPAVRLTDFGIARMADSLSRGRPHPTGPIGTPLYMAPELGTGGQPTPSVDIYSAGIVLYEMLAGAPPFDEANPTEMLRAHVEREPLPIRGVPRPVWNVLAAMLEKEPARRPPGAAAAARALEDALSRLGDQLPRQRGDDEDTWERIGAAPWRTDAAPEKRAADSRGADPEATGSTVMAPASRDGVRHLAGVGAAGGAAKAAFAGAAASEGPAGSPGPTGAQSRHDDWDDDAVTRIGPAVGGPSGPRGGRDDDAVTRIGPAIGGPAGPRGGWDDDAATRIGPAIGGPSGPRDGWDDDAATRVGPAIGGPAGPRGGWDDDAATRVGPAIGGASGPRGGWDPAPGGPAGPRGGWDDDDYDDPPTDGQPVRVPSRSRAIQSSRNTVISAIPASRQPAPSGGSRPPGRDNRQRLRVAAGAGIVVALIAAAGGWALASSGGGPPTTDTATVTNAAGGSTSSRPYVDNSGHWVDPTATAPYVRDIGGQRVTVNPASSGPARQSAPASQAQTTAAGAPTTPATSATPSYATVPDVVGMSKGDANSAIANRGFTGTPSWTDKCVDTSIPIGQVISQDPEAGAKADKSTAISGTAAGDCLSVPNETGVEASAAKSALESKGFSVGLNGPWTCDYGYSTVSSQSPASGRALKGSSVNITYTCKASPPPPPSPTPTG